MSTLIKIFCADLHFVNRAEGCVPTKMKEWRDLNTFLYKNIRLSLLYYSIWSKLAISERERERERERDEGLVLRLTENGYDSPQIFLSALWVYIRGFTSFLLWQEILSQISSSNEQLQQQLEYTLLKPDCHCWWISKKQSGRENTLEERYAIKFCFKVRKNATETNGMLQTASWPSCINRTSVFEWHKRFKEGRESVRDDERCGRSMEVNTPELIRVRVRVTMLRF